MTWLSQVWIYGNSLMFYHSLSRGYFLSFLLDTKEQEYYKRWISRGLFLAKIDKQALSMMFFDIGKSEML